EIGAAMPVPNLAQGVINSRTMQDKIFNISTYVLSGTAVWD
ncbi:hypothetical protein A2U01_0103655, partial [Trifolium medium]|nr:hypothetical protein [Trifolium medium]